jgi:hypothetical protein
MIAEFLAAQGIFTWDGNYYALNLTERLQVEQKGGMLRIRRVHYNRRPWRRDCPQPRSRGNHACVWSPFQSSADGSREIHHAALCSAVDLFSQQPFAAGGFRVGCLPSRSPKCGQRRAIFSPCFEGSTTSPASVRYSVKDFQEAVSLADGEAGQEKVLLDFSD